MSGGISISGGAASGGGGGGTAAATTFTPVGTIAGTNVQTAVAEVATDAIARETVSPANTQTANYTLALSDVGKTVELNLAGANTLTVPPNSSVAFPIDTVLNACQLGVGQTTLTPGAGVTLRNASSLTTRAQYSTVTLRKRGTDEWVVGGDTT